jgi:hypothetical protein
MKYFMLKKSGLKIHSIFFKPLLVIIIQIIIIIIKNNMLNIGISLKNPQFMSGLRTPI